MGWARLDDNRHDHPKILNLGDGIHALAAVGLLDHAITWASRHRNDSKTPGLVPWSFWQQRAGKHAPRLTGLLLREGLVDQDPDDRGVWIHDFANYGPKRDSAEASAAGRRGAAARWQKPSPSQDKSHADPIANDASRAAAPAFPSRPDPSEEQPPQPSVGTPQAKRAAAFPERWFLDSDLRSWAADKCPAVDVNAETEQWADYHRAKGDTAKDWSASWRTWMRNAQKWSRTQQQRPSNMDGHLALVRRLEAAEVQQGEIA